MGIGFTFVEEDLYSLQYSMHFHFCQVRLLKHTSLVVLLLFLYTGNTKAQDFNPLECSRLDTFNVHPLKTEEDISAFIQLYDQLQGSTIYASIETLEKAFARAKELGLQSEITDLAYFLLIEYLENGSSLEKKISTSIILENNIQFADEDKISKIYNFLGNISDLSGDNISALSYYQKAYDSAGNENLNDKLYPLGNLAETFLANQDTVNAIELIHKTINLTNLHTDQENIAYNNVYDYSALGSIHLAQGQIDSAKIYFNLATKASKYFPPGHRRFEELTILTLPSLFSLNLESRNFKKAKYFLDSLNLIYPDQAQILRAEYHKAKGEYHKALTFTENPIESDLILDHTRVELRQNLASKLNLFKISEEASTELLKIAEQNLARSKKELLTISKAQLLASEKQRKLEAQRYENQLELFNTRLRIWIAFILILLSSAIAIWFKKRYQDTKKQSQDLSKIVTRHEEDLIEANKQLASKVKSMERFNHLLSHDLREPLRSISGFTSILRRKAKPYKELETDLALLSSSVEQLSFLMIGVETLRKTEERQYCGSEIDINQVIINSSKTVKAKYSDHDININHSGDFTPVHLDAYFLNRSLLELIDNAVKFCKDKTAFVTIEVTQHDGELAIYVQDEGIGMNVEFSEQIFKIFKRLNRREHFMGAGVGLALVKLATEKSSGSIELLESKLGKGSTFKLKFPLDAHSEAQCKQFREAMLV